MEGERERVEILEESGWIVCPAKCSSPFVPFLRWRLVVNFFVFFLVCELVAPPSVLVVIVPFSVCEVVFSDSDCELLSRSLVLFA